jgi:hypothetical protein
MIWGFATDTISTNLACRLLSAVKLYTVDNRNPWISMLGWAGLGYHESLMRNGLQNIGKGHGQHEDGIEG